jgi:GntR family transcriptional repressor for pyruvate dehydrogenase complex
LTGRNDLKWNVSLTKLPALQYNYQRSKPEEGDKVQGIEIDDLKKVKLSEALADKLENIILGDIKLFGQKLPSEQELAKNFGVSRNIVREALKLLKERGLVTSRTGDGSYFSKPEPQTLTNLISRMLVMNNIDAENIYEMRVMLECNACILAAQRATEADLDSLAAINREMEEKQQDLDVRVDLDLQFHARIAEISGNALLSIFVKSMTHLRKVMIRQAIQSLGGSQDGNDYHGRVIAALRVRDAGKAEQIMREHLTESMRRHKEFEKAKHDM